MQKLICLDYYVVKLGCHFTLDCEERQQKAKRRRLASGKFVLTRRGLESFTRIIFHFLTKPLCTQDLPHQSTSCSEASLKASLESLE